LKFWSECTEKLEAKLSQEEFNTWIKPLKNESLNSYAFRMTKFIDSKNPILVGVSLGGVLVQEISKIIKCEKIIIISSIKSRSELPVSMKMAKYTNIHKLLPIKWIEDIERREILLL